MLDDTQRLSLRTLMPLYMVKTIMIDYAEREKEEAQWLHRLHARYVFFPIPV